MANCYSWSPFGLTIDAASQPDFISEWKFAILRDAIVRDCTALLKKLVSITSFRQLKALISRFPIYTTSQYYTGLMMVHPEN